MPRSFTFGFSELPLLIENGIEAGLVNGSADISYFSDGVWGIEAISLEGYRKPTSDERAAGKLVFRKYVTVDQGTPTFLIIYHRLEHEWRDTVQDAVNSQIDEDRASAPDNRADRKHELRVAS